MSTERAARAIAEGMQDAITLIVVFLSAHAIGFVLDIEFFDALVVLCVVELASISRKTRGSDTEVTGV